MKFSCRKYRPCLSSELLQVVPVYIIKCVLLNSTWGKLITVVHSGYVVCSKFLRCCIVIELESKRAE